MAKPTNEVIDELSFNVLDWVERLHEIPPGFRRSAKPVQLTELGREVLKTERLRRVTN